MLGEDVKVLELHYEFEKICNRVHSGLMKDISSVDIDSYLNESKDRHLRIFDKLVEKNRVVENDIRWLETKVSGLDKLSSSEGIDVYKLPSDYYNYIRVTAKGCTSKCSNPVTIRTTKYTQQDDLNESLKDPFKKPSWRFVRGIYNIIDRGIEFYHNNEYEVKDLTLYYIKYIPDVAAPSLAKGGAYLKADGVTNVTKNINLDLPRNGTLWRDIVRIAALLRRKDVDENFSEDINLHMFNQTLGVQ